MQIMFGTILCVLLKGLILTKATITPKDDNTSNIIQEKSISMYPDLNFTQDISMSEKNNHHILNFKSDRSYSDSTMRNEQEVDEVTPANISIISESIESRLSKPTSLRAFVQFDSQFTEKINDIFVTLRWNQSEFTAEVIQGYTVQCFFIDLKEIQICDKNITTTALEHTMHNLKSNTTYYFRVRAHTEVIAGPYSDLIDVSTTHENPISKLLFTTREDIQIWDMDLNTFTNFGILMSPKSVINAVYSIQEHRIYWSDKKDLMTLKINENNITKIARLNYSIHDLCIDWVAKNLYWTYSKSDYFYIVKFDLSLWENGMIKLDEIFKLEIDNGYLSISPFMGFLYHITYNQKNQEYDMIKYHLDGKNEQIIQINASSCLFHYIDFFRDMIIDNTNNKEPLIYWLSKNYTTVTDINISMCNMILHKKNVDNINFKSMTIDKTNIYILAIDSIQYILYVLKKKYANLKSINADEYVEKILISSDKNDFYSIYAFDKSLQLYPPMKCLTPYEKVYNFENVTAMANSIIVNLPEPVVKSGCKKYNLPTTIYTISVSCLDNNLNKSEKFTVLTGERHYEIQNLTPFTEYKLKFTLSNFYFDQLSINPFDSNVIPIKTNSGKLNAPENISVLALTPTIAVVYWMPPKKLNCVVVTYEVHWKLVKDTQQESKQFINVPKRMVDGRFFTKINLFLPVQDYLIYVRVYPINFSDFYNESLSKIVDIYSEPNNITLSRAYINSMVISWISNINLTIIFTLEYKGVAAEKWQTMHYIKMNYNEEATYHIKNLQLGTLYKFRLILKYPEYEESFIWPADERFIFSTLESSLSKPTSLRAFVQFDRQFTGKVNDIFATLRWNQSEFTDEIIQEYTVQCFFIEDLKEIQICDDKNITTLEHTVHNLKPITTYYFRVRAYTEVIAGPYSDLINVSTTHENPIPKLLLTTNAGIDILDLDSNTINNLVKQLGIKDVAYWAQEHKIYWITENDLMTLDITKNNITKIASFDYRLFYFCIDWVARNLYWTYSESDYYYIVKFDLTMWENGIIKFDEIFKERHFGHYPFDHLILSPSMGILYRTSYDGKNGNKYDTMKYHFEGKNIGQINSSLFPLFYLHHMIIDNNEEPLIYWIGFQYIVITNTNFSMCNILNQTNVGNNISFKSVTIDKTNIYILAYNRSQYTHHIYVLKKKYVSLKSVNIDEYEKIIIAKKHTFKDMNKIYAFDKYLQPYPPMRCLTPYEKVYNFENVIATANSIIVNLPEPVVKSGCKKYNLPTTIYTISISCLDKNLNKSEKFNVQTYERYYEIQNLTPFTEYKLKFTLSNFYFDQLSINPFDSNVISIKTNSGKLNAPENISVLALTPTIAIVHWMPLKKMKCEAVTYEVHWKSVTLVNGTQQKNKQFINMPKCMADGRFFTKINLSLPVQDYFIYVRVYPSNFSDFYNESLSKTVHIYSEPNNITLREVNTNSMDISWISNFNLTVFLTLEYKEVATEKWQPTHYIKMNYNKEATYHIGNLQSGTSYKFRLILRYFEYEENFIWPPDERFIFSTLSNSSLNKPTSLRAFVQFDSQFTENVNDIFVTLRWDQPELTDKIIQGYTVQCFFKEDLKKIQICDDKNITTTTLEHTMHNLKPNTTYYFRVCAHTKIVASPYTDLINVSTTHENPIPQLLLTTNQDIQIWDVDLNTITNFKMSPQSELIDVAYSIQEYRIYWITRRDLMTLKINENNITKIDSFDHDLHDLCIDWVARNLYLIYQDSDYSYIVKFDLTMWENGIIKFDNILKKNIANDYLNVLPSMGILYRMSYNWMNGEYDMMKYHLDGKNEQIVEINSFFYLFYYIHPFSDMIIHNMNNEESLIYWLRDWSYTIVTDINISKFNKILYKEDISDDIKFQSMTIDKTNIYILAYDNNSQYKSVYTLYVLKQKYASLKNVSNAYKYVEKIPISSDKNVFRKIYAFDKYLQPYPPMRCLTPDEKIYNFENVTAMANSIIVNLPEPVVKSGCKKYNLPTTIYTISISCLVNNLNKSEKFNVQMYERYYEIQNLTPFTEYKLKFTLSNFYFDQLSINPFDSNVTRIKTNLGKLNAPENISVLALTPTIAVVYWIPPKKVNCVTVTYEVHWKLVNDTQQENKQFINVPKHVADGRFFTKINLSLPVQNYLILYVRVYPSNFSDFYNESLSKIVDIYSEPNNITLNKVDINSMDISWISNINLTILFTLEYKDIAAERWQTMNYTKMNYNKEIIYHVENLQSGTPYKFRLILRYFEYEENFTWPADERFIFSTFGSKRDMLDTPGIIAKKYYLLLILGFIVIIIITCVIYYWYRQRRGNNIQFLSSTMTDIELGILPCQYSQINPIYSSMLHYNPDECAITKIARKQIIFTKIIGSGAFGMVYQGKVKNLEGSDKEVSVALKTLRKGAFSHEKKGLLKEAKLMNHFRHKHILRLLGVCLDGISPFLVLELMETGDLLKYLRDCRNLEASDSHALRLQDLFSMCEDVARGCCYLEEMRFVHRDLACRNCLISSRNRENRVIKIGDFGLSRNIYQNDYYRMRGEDLLPVRWMAPESLMIRLFTSQSDVWSFGVLMWEITSLAEQPYSGKSNGEVINYVRDGGRLPMPLNCPSALYRLMQNCWSGSAAARPSFKFCLKNIITLRENIEDALLSPVDTT